MGNILQHIVSASVFFVLTIVGASNLHTATDSNSSDPSSESLFLPKREAVEVLSFGYKTTLANALWFKTVSYFGKHYRSDKNYEWLSHMCELVTDLNPNSTHVFEFGSLMLAWEAKKPKEAISLLDKAISAHPTDWKFLYLRGFFRYFFFNDIESAKNDFVSSAKLPGAHPVVKRIAAKELAASEGPERAVEFLIETLKTTDDPRAKEALTERLKEALLEKGFKSLRIAVEVYVKRFNKKPSSIEDLVKEKIVAPLGPDPFGGSYKLDPNTGEPYSTSGKVGLSEKESPKKLEIKKSE